ncbi:ABC transporter substrate-binding protein [Bacillaceae bacterium W0354]
MINKQKLTRLFLALFLVLAVGLAACGNNDDSDKEDKKDDVENVEKNNEDAEKESDDQSNSDEASKAVTITDKSGTEVTIEEKPEKIITAVPSATEIVFAVGAGDKVIGVTEWDNYPEEVFEIEKIGDMNLNIEKIVELEPDLVVADLLNAQDVDALRDVGVKVVVLGAQSLEEVYEDLELVGKATWNEENANKLIKDMKEQVAFIQDKVSGLSEEERKSVWMEIDPELFSAAKGTFLHELLTLAGGENIIGDMEGWPQVSEEIVLERDPDVIITTYGYYVDDPAGTVLSRENWQGVTAVKNEQVVDIHSDLLSRAGPRLVDGLTQLANALYPDLFE